MFEDGNVTNKADHIRTYIDGTIERLGFTPDLYYLHRIDPRVYLPNDFAASAVDFSTVTNAMPW